MWWPVYGRPQKESQTFLSRFSSSDVKMMAEGVFIMSKHGSAEANQESTKTIKQRANSLFNIAAGWPIVAVVLVLSFIVARCGTNESSSVDHQYSLANIQAQTLVLAQQEQSIDLTEWLKATVLADREIENFIVQRAPRVQKVLLNAASRTAAEFLPASTHTKFVVQPREVGVAELLLKASASAPTKLLRVVIVPGEQRTFDPNGDAITLRGPSKAVQSAHVLYTLSSDEATSFSGSVGINWGGASYTAEGLGDSDCCKADSGSSAGCVIDDTVDVCAPLPFVGGDAGEGWAFINAARKQALYSRSGRVPLPHQLFVLASNKTSTESKNFMVEAKPTTGNSKKLSVDIYNYEYGDNDRLRRVGAVTAPTFFRVPSASQLQSVSVERHEGTSGNAQSPRGIKLSWDCPQAGRSISSGGSELGRLQHKVPYCNAMASVANGARAWLQGGDTFYMPVAGYKVERCECSDNTCSGGQCGATSSGWAVLARAVGSDIRSLSVPSATGGIYYHNNKLNYYNLYNAEGVSLSSASVNKALAANKFYRYRVLALNQALASSGPTLGGCDTSVSGNTREGGPCFDLNDAGVSGANRGSLMAGLGAPPATPSGGTPSGGGSGGNPGGGATQPIPDVRLSLRLDSGGGGDAGCDGVAPSTPVEEGDAVYLRLCLSKALKTPLRVWVETQDGSARASSLSSRHTSSQAWGSATISSTTTSGGEQTGVGYSYAKSTPSQQQAADSSGEESDSSSGGGVTTTTTTTRAETRDYEGRRGEVVIPPKSRFVRLTVPTNEDQEVERHEDFLISARISDAKLASEVALVDGGSLKVLLHDRGDAIQTLSLSGPQAPVVEGGPATFTISLNSPARDSFYVRVRTIDGTAIGSTVCASGDVSGTCDYLKRGGRDGARRGQVDQEFCVQIPQGVTSREVSVPVCKDAAFDDGETFTLEVSEPLGSSCISETEGYYGSSGYRWPNYLGISGSPQATAIIKDAQEATNTQPLLVGFFDSDGYAKTYVADEPTHPTASMDPSATQLPLTVRLKKAMTVPLTLGWQTQGRTAQAGADYTRASGTIELARGATSANFSVGILSDNIVEGDEWFNVVLTADAANCQKLKDQKLFLGNCLDLIRPRSSNDGKNFIARITLRDADVGTLGFVKNSRGETLSSGEAISIMEGSDFNCVYRAGAWQDAKDIDGVDNNAHCVFVGVKPSDNVAERYTRSIEFYVTASPLAGLTEPKAGMGSDWRGETSWPIRYSYSRCPNNICGVPVGCAKGVASNLCRARSIGSAKFGIRDDSAIERDEALMLSLVLAEGSNDNIRLSQTAKRKKLIIKNDDFASVTIKYARLGVGQDASSTECDQTQHYKFFDADESVGIFDNSNLCISIECDKGNNFMPHPLKLSLYKATTENGQGTPVPSPYSTLEWGAALCNGTAQYAALNIASGSEDFWFQARLPAMIGGSPHLHAEQIQVQDSREQIAVGPPSVFRYYYTRLSDYAAVGYEKEVDVVSTDQRGPSVSFVYRGQSSNSSCSPWPSPLESRGDGSAGRPHSIKEPETSSTSAHFACFQGRYYIAGDKFETTSAADCSSAPTSLSVGPVRWAAPRHQPVIYFGNPERSGSSPIVNDFQSVPTNAPNQPEPKLMSLTWPVRSQSGDDDGSTCLSGLVALAQVPYDDRPDAQARGFKVNFEQASVSPVAVRVGSSNSHFYIPKTLEDVPEPQGKAVGLAYLGRSMSADCDPLVQQNGSPDLTRTLKAGEYACFQAEIKESGALRATTEDLALQLTTSSTDAPSEYVAATSSGDNADYAAPRVFDDLGNDFGISALKIASGQSKSNKISIEINEQAPGRGDKWFKVILAKPDGAGWPEGFAMGRKTEVGIAITHTDTTKPALAFKALAHVGAESSAEAIAKCRNAADYTQLNNDVPSGDRIGDADIKARVDEGRFVCAQSVYLTFDADVNSGANNCYKPGRRGGCWIRGSTPADNLTNITLKNLSKAANKAEETSDYGAPIGGGLNGNGAGLVISNNKDISNIFVIEIKENKDVKVAGDEYEVLKSGLMHANMPANLQFLSSTAFNIEIPYSPEGADRDAPGYDGDEAPVPAIQVAETKLVKPTDSDAIVQFVFRGDNDLPSRQQQSQYIIQSCAIDDTGNGVPAQPAHDADCWRAAGTATGPGNGLVCSRVVASAAAEATNAGQLIKTSSVRPYTFTCTVAALAGKYHFFRVQDTGSSGVSDNSEFAYSRAVSVPAAPDKSDVFPPHGEGSDPSPIMARKVGSGTTLGIELSWKCPTAAHRKWTCNDGAVPRELRIAENLDNADNDDIVDYQVWRCKMRNVNKGSTWAQTDSKRWNATKRGAKSPSSDFEDTYTKEDGMVCEDFFGWLAEGETRLPPGGAVPDAPDYGWPPNYDGYWAGIPAEKSYLIKMIWGDLRFGGAYADVISIAGRTLLNAASRATAPKLHTEFKVANGKIIFTDRSSNVPFTERRERSGDTPAVAASEGGPEKGFSHGRYKYRIRAITKLGAPVDAYCDGRGATMRDRLEGSAQACTSMPTASGKAADFGTSPLGLVAKGQPKPTNVSVERIEGDDTKLKLTWLGRTPLIQIEGGKTSTKTDDKFLHVYALRHCATDNHGDSCSSFNAICNAPPRGNNGLVSCPGGARPRDSQRDQTKKLASEDAFDSETDSNKVFSAHALHIKSSCTDDADELARDSNKVRCNISDIASSSPYKFGCIVSGLDKTKYHRFRVAEQETTGPCVSVSGEGASSDWATTEPTLTTKPSLGVISAAKVTVGTGDAAKEGIQLSWACPPTSHRKWACGGSTKTALNMTGASGQGAPDDDDIVDYHIYRCKMRDTNANGDYTDTTDDHTYNDSDDMSCQPLMNYDGYVVQESDTPGTPTEAQLATARASVNKLVWGDTRFGGAYADGTTTLTNAALKAADSERATCATFETVQDDAQDANTKRILFTDTCGLLSGGNLPNDGLAPGRYHYLVKAIKSGNLPAAEVASAQCGGVAKAGSDPLEASTLSSTLQDCTSAAGASKNHNGLSVGASFSYNMGAVKVQQNSSNEIQLSWSCPAEAQRDWDCAGGTTVGTGSDAGYLLDSDNTDNAARNNPNKVGRYKIYRCMQGSGEAATRCSANTDWMSASPPDYVKTSHKVTFAGTGNDAKILFVDDDVAWRSGTDTSSTHGAVAGKKYIYNVVVQNEFGTSATAATRKACQGPASLRNTVGSTAANCATTGTGISLHDRFAIYNLKIQKDGNNKVVLSWDCPLAAHRDWSCQSSSSTTQGGVIQPPSTNRNSNSKVGYYIIRKCKVESGGNGLGRCAEGTFDEHDVITRTVSFDSGSPGRVIFTDENSWQSGSPYGQGDSSYGSTNSASNEKWVYKISVYSDVNTKLSGPITCSGPSGITSTPQACTSASTDTGVTIP